MNETPFFSVILPVYNGERYVAQAIESVLEQSETDWELIIINDASRDRTAEIVDEYAARNPRIRVLHNPYNLHIAGSLNRGIETAKGEWIARIDSDDSYKQHHLKRMKHAILRTERDYLTFFSSWITVMDETGKQVLDLELPDARTVRRMMPLENFLYHPATCFSKAAWQYVGGYPTDRMMAEDTAMWLRFFKAGLRLVMVPECLVYYRIHNSNNTSLNDALLYRATRSAAETKSLRQYREWRISLFLKQNQPEKAREELKLLMAMSNKPTFKNLQYYFLTFMPSSLVYAFMWEIRPRLRYFFKNVLGLGRHARV
ncbi:MAG TPA: glycosyltransferase family 2 protein [Verrucomicrobiae bacterium]|nr:glycosyltransferase family 2 protein [Verrucomicrobiae bacterium]